MARGWRFDVSRTPFFFALPPVPYVTAATYRAYRSVFYRPCCSTRPAIFRVLPTSNPYDRSRRSPSVLRLVFAVTAAVVVSDIYRLSFFNSQFVLLSSPSRFPRARTSEPYFDFYAKFRFVQRFPQNGLT